MIQAQTPEKTMKATFAGGCFWCMQPPFEDLEGVTGVKVGYTGGHKDKPTYEDVCTGTTGHAESPEEIAFAGKLSAFLDGCDELVGLLEKKTEREKYSKQSEVIKSRRSAIPPPPKGIAWAEEAAQSTDQILLALTVLDYSNAEQNLLGEAARKTA